MDPINWHSFFFLLFALAASLFAVAVVISSNVVRMAFFLVMSLGAVAGLFFLAGADFLGSVQLMVYVGGTMVLLIFGVMLTARGPFVSMQTGAGQWIMAAIIAGSLLAVLLQTALNVETWRTPAVAGHKTGEGETVSPGVDAENTATPLGMGLLGIRTHRLEPENTSRRDMAGYLLPFEIVSVHLLVVLVGAAYLARAKRRRNEEE